MSIDLVEAELWSDTAVMGTETPESLFERRWALSLLEKVAARLREEHAATGKATHFEYSALESGQSR